MRQLEAMATARLRIEGDVAGHLIRSIPIAIWNPAELKNLGHLFLEEEMSEAMRAHLASWERDRWRAMVKGA